MNNRILGPLRAARAAHEWIAQKLSRVTSSGDLIPEVDGLRFLAIGAVVFHHLVSIYLPASGRAAEIRTTAQWFAAANESWFILAAYCGHFGVNLFFVISGFILAVPFIKRAFNQMPPPAFKSYYLRRVTRIEPPYVLCLIVYLLIKWQDGNPIGHLLPNFLASAFYLHGPIYGHESVINGVAWSLEVEIQFYVLVPLLMWGFNLRSSRFRRGSLIVAILAFGLFSQMYVYPYAAPWMRMSLLNFMHYFLAGFLLAEFYLSYNSRSIRKSWWGDLLTFGSGAMIFAVLLRFGQIYFLLPLAVVLLYAGFYLGRISNWMIRWRWIVIAGGMCYTIYLYHVMIIAQAFVRTAQHTSQARSFGLDFFYQCLIICPLVLVICAILFVLTEKPFMRWSLSKR